MAPKRLWVTQRQVIALHRAIQAMTLVGGQISVTGPSDLLSTEEMNDLVSRLRNAVEQVGEVEIKFDF